MTLLSLLNILLRRVLWFILVPVVFLALGLAYALTRPVAYTATSILKPEGSSSSLTQLAGVAAQFGLNVPGDARGQSVDTYAQLLLAPDVLREVVQKPFPAAGNRTLLRHYAVDAALPQRMQLQRATGALEGSINVTTMPAAGLLYVKTTADTPELAEAINDALITALERRTEERRRSRAQTDREFVDSQLRDAQSDLSRAENSLKAFRERNHVVQSPELVTEQGRLERTVQLRQSMYLSLAQGLEQARVNELRSGPTLSIIGNPAGTAVRRGRHLSLVVVLSILVGMFVASALALVAHYWNAQREGGGMAYLEFIALRDRMLGRRAARRLAGD